MKGFVARPVHADPGEIRMRGASSEEGPHRTIERVLRRHHPRKLAREIADVGHIEFERENVVLTEAGALGRTNSNLKLNTVFANRGARRDFQFVAEVGQPIQRIVADRLGQIWVSRKRTEPMSRCDPAYIWNRSHDSKCSDPR